MSERTPGIGTGMRPSRADGSGRAGTTRAEATAPREAIGPSAVRRASAGPRRETAGRCAAAGAAILLLALGGAPEAAAAQDLPQGVTREMVEQGRDLFTGDGFCYTCHGRDGTGMSGAGGDLTDGQWRHVDGSFESLVSRIRNGVRANASSTGVPMPPAGGAELPPEQIRAVAAYVWTLGRGGG